MPQIRTSPNIDGVKIVELKPFADERGRFIETFRKEWFPQRSWDIIQANRSDSRAGVLRGLHYHFNQVDYWYVLNGTIRAALADIRPDSPTAGATETIELGADRPLGLFIPVGVAHGFVALSDATLTYIVDNYYDSSDEFGVAWNDPQLDIQWKIDHPVLSERDAQNPFLRDIPDPQRPPFNPAIELER